MTVWNNEDIFNISRNWNGGQNVTKDSYTVSNSKYYNKNGCFLYNDDFKNFLDNYNNLFKKENVKIKSEDIIYFFKESKYPRFKFNSNCGNKKTIKIESADWLVTPNIMLFDNYNKAKDKNAILCTLTNRLYLYDYIYSNYAVELKNLYKQNSLSDNILSLLQDKFIIQGDNYEIISVKSISNYVSNGANIKEFIHNVANNINKCITEENLDAYLSKESPDLTNDIIESINLMLQSKDSGTIELGIKMLNNFDCDKYSLKLGNIIRNNVNSIYNNKAKNTVGFKNVLKSLNIDNLANLTRTDHLQYYRNLYSSSTNEENKNEIKELYKNSLLTDINNYIIKRHGSNSIIDLNVDLNIN